MSVHVLLNFLKELGKRDKISVPRFFAMSLIYSIKQEHEC